MATTHPGIVLRRLRQLATANDTRSVPDRQLLERFTRGRDEAAFDALVRRHGPLVLGVCRRLLHQEQDVEDVFQATFLVLARKAGSVGGRASVGTWLYRVAYNMALKARKQAAARQKREARSARQEATDPLAEVTGRELLAVFDEEMQALPDGERQALVLCYLQGKTRDEAAREVGCSESTLKRRLERGKGRMRVRLAHRGVALPAALLAAGLAQGVKAAVPAALTSAAVKVAHLVASGQEVAGVVPAQVTALAAGAVRAMVAGKAKAVAALLVTLTLLGIGAGLLASAPPPATQKNEPKAAPAVAQSRSADEKKEMIVAGRVLDTDDKPLTGAEVSVLAVTKQSQRGGELSSIRLEQLGRGKTDAEGRFRLGVPRALPDRVAGVAVVAAGTGHGIGWEMFRPDAIKPAEIRLAPEEVIRGRLVDVQGQPAAGVSVHLRGVSPGKGEGEAMHVPALGQEFPSWPKAAVTDKDGRFEVRGVGRGMIAALAVSDDRFAAQGFSIPTGGPEAGKEVLKMLEPAHIIEGTVTYADTGKPVPGARLTVYAGKSELDSMFGAEGRADEKGRFRINPSPGNYFHVSAYAPDGQPYLTLQKKLKWPKAAVKQQLDLTLPRGVLVRGKAEESGTGKALAKATVQFIPRRADNPNFRADALTGWENTVVSGEDGRFDICVLPGPGHLLIHGPTPDYIYAEIGGAGLFQGQGKAGGERYYAHAIVPLDLKPGAEAHDLAATLRRAVTVKGRVLGPDGKPVAEALMLSRLGVDSVSSYWRGFPVIVRDGRFELHGCDPEKTYPVSFLDTKNKAGATVELSGKQAGEEVTVRLAPCGQATTRLLDGDGKPIAKQGLWLELVVTPGPSRYDLKRLYDKGELGADSEYVGNIDHVNYGRNGPQTDAEGRITFPALVPGATYRIVEVGDREDMIKCEFKAESGKTTKLPDVVRKKQP
jgi:RNA polymerase sigma factor (sigma-70 family)